MMKLNYFPNIDDCVTISFETLIAIVSALRAEGDGFDPWR